MRITVRVAFGPPCGRPLAPARPSICVNLDYLTRCMVRLRVKCGVRLWVKCGVRLAIGISVGIRCGVRVGFKVGVGV